jgi:hypothetical protein
VYQQQNVFYTANQMDSAIVFVVGLVIAAVGGALANRLGLFFVIILGLPAGGLISELALQATHRRRGRNTWLFIVAGIVVGTVLGALMFDPSMRYLIQYYQVSSAANAGSPEAQQALQQAGVAINSVMAMSLIQPLLFAAMAAGAVVARMRPKN